MKITKYAAILVGVTFCFLLFNDFSIGQMLQIVVPIIVLDRFAAWFDRNVPDSNPKKFY